MLPETKKLYAELQRVTSKDRLDALVHYIVSCHQNRIIGAIPPLCLASFQPITFTPVPELPGAGWIEITTQTRMLLDGKGRLGSAFEVLERHPELIRLDPERRRGMTLPPCIISPLEGELTTDQVGKIFADMNFRSVKVPARVNAALDKFDPYLKLANELAELPPLNGRVQTRATKVGVHSDALLVQLLLMRFVRGCCEDRWFQESNRAFLDNPYLTERTFDEERERIQTFLAELAARMGEAFENRDLLHLSAPGFQGLGIVYHDLFHKGLNLPPREIAAIMQKLSEIDWAKHDPDDSHQPNPVWREAGLALIPGTGRQTGSIVLVGAGRSNAQAIIDHLRKVTGLQERLDARDREHGRAAELHVVN